LKKLSEEFLAHRYGVRGLKAGGIRLAAKEAVGVTGITAGNTGAAVGGKKQ